MDFFDAYPCFYRTSTVGATPNRLNSRYRAIIEANLDCIRGHSVLDLASHDGRWSFAALRAGARRVLGIEGRPQLVARAMDTFSGHGVSPETYSFVVDNIYNSLPGIPPGSIDTVFCLGFLYHTLQHYQLLAEFARIRPRHLILDTCISTSTDCVIDVRTEDPRHDSAVCASPGDTLPTSLVGYPSRRALDTMLENFGFRSQHFDWRELPGKHWTGTRNWRGIEDYRDGKRITLRAELEVAGCGPCEMARSGVVESPSPASGGQIRPAEGAAVSTP